MKRLATVLILVCGTVWTLTGCSGIQGAGKGADKVCTVHQVPLQKTKVPIAYGMPMWSDYDQKVREESSRSFPHSAVHVEGGCIVEKNAPKQAAIWQCPKCVQAKAEWVKQHPRPEKDAF